MHRPRDTKGLYDVSYSTPLKAIDSLEACSFPISKCIARNSGCRSKSSDRKNDTNTNEMKHVISNPASAEIHNAKPQGHQPKFLNAGRSSARRKRGIDQGKKKIITSPSRRLGPMMCQPYQEAWRKVPSHVEGRGVFLEKHLLVDEIKKKGGSLKEHTESEDNLLQKSFSRPATQIIRPFTPITALTFIVL